MTLSKEQLSKLIEAYANEVVDNMDVRDLCAFAVDSIIDNMDGMAEEDIIKEIQFYYDDEDRFEELIESVQ
jgi:hypothetical protein